MYKRIYEELALSVVRPKAATPIYDCMAEIGDLCTFLIPDLRPVVPRRLLRDTEIPTCIIRRFLLDLQVRYLNL